MTVNVQAPPDPGAIMQLGLGFWGSKVLLSAVELGVFTELAMAPADLDTLTDRLGLHPRASRDFLDALVSLGMLERKDGVYSNAPASMMYLDRGKPTYLGGLLEMANARLWPFWGKLTEALRTGLPQNEASQGGGDLFETLYSNPERLQSFLQAMTAISTGSALAIAEKFPWDRYKTLVDVGGAEGCVPVHVAKAHSHIQATVFDLPQVQAHSRDYVESMGMLDRVSFKAGDFFRDPWPQADVFVMGHILHDWSLEQKRALLARAYDFLNPGGAVIVYESIIDDERRNNSFGLLMSLNMLIETAEGFDYTGADCRGWMEGAGFKDCYVQHLAGPESMVVGFKK